MMSSFYLIICYLIATAHSFIIGGCIGPKSVFERYLNPAQKAELRKLVHSTFDGTNSEQVLASVNTYVHSALTPQQWSSIVPELRMYQSQNRECSIYAQLLPTEMYKQLVKSVFKAAEMGVDDRELKRLVEDYVDRAIRSGFISQNTPPGNPVTYFSGLSRSRVRYYPQRVIHEGTFPEPYMPSFSRRYPFSGVEYIPEQ
ncbi:hypothetical protein OESDEN_14013 [Oesophagostomum dentatum]|uniref:Uncharacterized protein n=1 Tax=Oesophagostomum dentatum TaxID=61180 RepID=A0A0B1SLQ7_OESDE|nr:hypothetical protein OESDEN_14013 [Oesophagostomum dentatum]